MYPLSKESAVAHTEGWALETAALCHLLYTESHLLPASTSGQEGAAPQVTYNASAQVILIHAIPKLSH